MTTDELREALDAFSDDYPDAASAIAEAFEALSARVFDLEHGPTRCVHGADMRDPCSACVEEEDT